MKKIYLLSLTVLCCYVLVRSQTNPRPVQFKKGSFTIDRNLQKGTLTPETLKPALHQKKFYALIQFDKTPGTAERKQLASKGIYLFDFIPGNAFTVELPDNTDLNSLKNFSASGIYAIPRDLKIADGLLQRIEKRTINRDAVVAVTFFGTIARSEVMAEIMKQGGQLVPTKIQPANALFIKASKTAVEKIAALPFVSYVSEQYLKDRPLNYDNRGLHAVNVLALSTGRNLQGKDISIGVGDDADPSSHLDFTGRLIQRNPNFYNSHGTHTTGTTGSAGLLNQKYKGMAPKSTLITQFYSDILVNTPTYINDYNMVLTNNSYTSSAAGCIGNGEYDILSYYVDAQMFTYPSLLHNFASGNDGGAVCAPYPASFTTVKSGFQCAKNVLTIGAFDNWMYTIANFSSRGPVDDGRIKPEIVAGGTAIYSTTPNNTYAPNWGTSMAAPTVTGTMALLYERYRQLHSGADPDAALIKTLACNSADDVGNPGPDFTYGFGMLNARTAVETMENNQYFENNIANGGITTHTITGIPAGTHQVKVMLYWPDYPSAPYSPTTLVNNLDLTVTGPDATVHFPLILNPASGAVNNNAVPGVDNINNIEQVVITNPPAGNFTITVNGTNIPTGSQNYVVAYEIIQPSVIVEYPYGNDTWVPGETETIRWSAYGANTNTFTVEYSINNGSSWIVLSNSVPATSRSYLWSGGAPNTPTNTALVRVTRNVAGYSDTSAFNFTILGQPALNVTNPCQGYAQLTWTAVTGATLYDIMMLKGDSMDVIATSAATNYLLSGLNKDSTYWLAVRAVISGSPGRRSLARTITPNGGSCTLPAFDNDFAANTVLSPVTGRMFTSTQLGNNAITVRLRNLGNIASSVPFNVSYQVNGGGVVTQNVAAIVAAHATYDHTFATPYNFSAAGTYNVKVWVSYPTDPQANNDTITTVIKQLENDPLVLSPNYIEGFESAAAQTYTRATRGLTGLDRCDFNTNNANGRGRTFVNTGFERNGIRCITLDQSHLSGSTSTDSLTITFNLSNYSAADQIWLDFYAKNHGVDFSAPNNRVWVRGNDLAAWVPVYTLSINPLDIGIYKPSANINITEVLAAAIPAQTISSSFQVKFGQQGFTSANSVIPDGNLDDGYSFDDVTISNALNDVGIIGLVSPQITGFCELSSAEQITVSVKNYSSSTATNVPVSYDINGSTVTETIPTINAGQTINYTFAQTADLSAPGQYDISVWVSYPTDNYANNDSLLHTLIHTTPLITSYPYLENFESNNGYWYTGGVNSSWQWGTPAKFFIDKAASGTKAWVTDTLGNYNNGEQSYLYSPCFDLSGMTQPVFSFSHIFRIEDDCDCDYHWVEYSLDDISWNTLGTVGSGTNWYNFAPYQAWRYSDTKWRVASFNVPVTASKVRFRIVMSSDPAVTYEGVGVDDVHIFDRASIYNGPNLSTGIIQNLSGNNWIDINMGSNRVVSINPNGQNLGNTTVKLWINTGPVRHTYTQYYLDRNIVIQPENQPSGNVDVRFYFLDTEVRNLINATGCSSCTTIPDAYEAGVTQYSFAPAEEDSTLYNNLTGLLKFHLPRQEVSIVPYDNGYYAQFTVDNFSEFWINNGGVSQDMALPLTLGTFTATKVGTKGLLEWSTSQETNSDVFIVEKSTDGMRYTEMGSVKAKGNSTTSSNYRFTDEQLSDGINYYRLKIKDRDGRSVNSPVRTIVYGTNELIVQLYPNPVAKDRLYISTSANCNRIDITDISGRTVKTVSTQGLQNTVSLAGISKGVYFVTVSTDRGKKVEKILVE